MTEARIVTNAELQKALDWLRDSANDIGEATKAAKEAGHYMDHVEALMFKASEETSDAKRRADARTTDKWMEAARDDAKAAGDLAKLKSLREAAAAKIEAWRSEQANFRSMKI